MTVNDLSGRRWSTGALAATVGVALTAAQISPASAQQATTFRATTALVTSDVRG
jgi:hypothetical protein